jgi:hypothetical protein
MGEVQQSECREHPLTMNLNAAVKEDLMQFPEALEKAA